MDSVTQLTVSSLGTGGLARVEAHGAENEVGSCCYS